MILLDTHAWIWWVQEPTRLTAAQASAIGINEESIIGVSAISCWEVAKLVQRNRLELPLPVDEWLTTALRYPAMSLIPITPRIAVESTMLSEEFHRDPADQLISATSRVLDCPPVTSDDKIIRYTRVQTVF